MDETISKVQEFHRAFGQEDPLAGCSAGRCNPSLDDTIQGISEEIYSLSRTLHRMAGANPEDIRLLRLQLMVEELSEVAEAMSRRDLPDLLHELCDLRYVADGSVLSFGLGDLFSAGFSLVHEANMSKLGPDGGPIRDTSGRVVKGPNFRRADLRGLFA